MHKTRCQDPTWKDRCHWHQSPINPACSWPVYSTATGTCRLCQPPLLGAHPLHYSPSSTIQTVSLEGRCGHKSTRGRWCLSWGSNQTCESQPGDFLFLTLWKITQTREKAIPFPTMNGLNTFTVKRCRTLDETMNEPEQKLWDLYLWGLGQILLLLLGTWSLQGMWWVLGG